MYVHEVLRYNDMNKSKQKLKIKNIKTKQKQSKINKNKNQQKTNDQKHKTDYYAPIIIGTIMRD